MVAVWHLGHVLGSSRCHLGLQKGFFIGYYPQRATALNGTEPRILRPNLECNYNKPASPTLWVDLLKKKRFKTLWP